MRAAQLVAPRQWELIETAKPQPAADQMLVKMERVAVCGSDKPPFCGVHKHYPQPPGATGHEGLGVVEACPSGRYREGERVLLWGFDRGLFQEYVLAKDDGNCIRLPGDLPAEKVLMSQLLGTVIHSFYKLGNIINRDVVVLGQGPVGLLFNAVLRNLGARRIVAMGAQAVVVKGGHRDGPATDVYYDGVEFQEFTAPRIDTPNTHGTGCTFASAVAAGLARNLSAPDAVAQAKRYVTEAIRAAYPIGAGHGPLNHFWQHQPGSA